VTTWVLHTDVSTDEVNLHLAALEAAGLLGIAEESGQARIYLPRRCADLPLAGWWEQVADLDWNEAWKAGIEPVTVGVVRIVPPWLAGDADGAAVTLVIELVIEPAQAFGTGHHETTTSCLAALQRLDLSGRRVLDVGTGTGVLALAAARLGAGEVVAVDTDPVAVTTALGNADRNGLQLDVRPGSIEVAGAQPFDVVVANLDTDTLVSLAAALAARLRNDAVLIAAGVSRPRQGEAVSALQAAGLAVSAHPGREWTLLMGRRAEVTPAG
jgi:ribosomal protein L11 methyltransferase